MTEPETPSASSQDNAGKNEPSEAGSNHENGSQKSSEPSAASSAEPGANPSASESSQSQASAAGGSTPDASTTSSTAPDSTSKEQTASAHAPELRSAANLADPSPSQPTNKPNPLVAILVLGTTVALSGGMIATLWRDGGQESNTPTNPIAIKLDDFAKSHLREKPPAAQAGDVGADWRRKCEDEQKIFLYRLEGMNQNLYKSSSPTDHTKRDVLLFLADAFRKSENQWVTTEKYYRLALAEPEDPPHPTAHPMPRMEILMRLAESLVKLQRYPEAEQTFIQAIKALDAAPPGTTSKDYLKHEADYELAETLMEENKLNDAEQLLKARQDIDKDPYSKALLQRDFGILDAKRGNLKGAEESFSTALKSFDQLNGTTAKESRSDNDRKVAMLLDEYAKVLRQLKKPDQAYALAQRARVIRDNPPPGMMPIPAANPG